jgi:hypothetical protein
VGGTASAPLQAAGWAASPTSLTGSSDLNTGSYGFKRIQMRSTGIYGIQRSKGDFNELRRIQTDLKVPKREIFVTELIILSHPFWIGDLRTVMGKHPDLMVGPPTPTIFPTIGRNFEIS